MIKLGQMSFLNQFGLNPSDWTQYATGPGTIKVLRNYKRHGPIPTRNGSIINGGLNLTSKEFNDEMGLSQMKPPGYNP